MKSFTFTFDRKHGIHNDVTFNTQLSVERIGARAISSATMSKLLVELEGNTLHTFSSLVDKFNESYKPGPAEGSSTSYTSRHITIFEGVRVTCDIEVMVTSMPESMDAIIALINNVQLHAISLAIIMLHSTSQDRRVIDLDTKRMGR